MPDIRKQILGNGVVVLALAGRLTLGHDCEQVESETDGLIRGGQTNVIFDLSNLKYMDSTGLGTLVMCSNRLKEAGGQLRLAGKGRVVDILILAQTNAIVPTYDSVDEAAAAFSTH